MMRFGLHCSHLLMATFLLAGVSGRAWAVDKKEVLQQASRSLYNLKAAGLRSVSCQASLDFDAAYRDLKMDDLGRKQVLPAAKSIRFQVAVGPTGAANVSHQFAEAPTNQEIADRLQKVAGGMERIISGFFQTWSSIMINSPFADSAEQYQFAEVPDGYRLTSDVDSTHVEIILDRTYTPISIAARTSNFDGTVHPHFIKQKDELLLQSYDARYKTNGAAPQELSVKVGYQDLDGLLIPHTVEVIVPLPQGRIDAPITLSNCQVQRAQ